MARYYDLQSLRELGAFSTSLLSETRADYSMAKFNIGKWTYGVPECRYQSYGDSEIRIGKFCSIAPNVRIFLAGEHKTASVATYPFNYMFLSGRKLPQNIGSKGSIVIGNDVWIGDGVLILSGVNIGDGAVVAARAVVSKDVPPYSIVGGIPAKLIRMRFTADMVEALLRIAWWNWPVEKIDREVQSLSSDDIDAFVKTHDRQ